MTTNREFAHTNEDFRKACEIAGIKPTARQSSKFRNKHGKAWETYLTQKNSVQDAEQ